MPGLDRWQVAVPVPVLCAFVAGCAVMTPASVRVYAPRGATQVLLVRSDPEGATCTLRQSGAEVGILTATPDSIAVPRRPAAVEVACRKEGYLETRLTFAPLNLNEPHNRAERIAAYAAEDKNAPRYERTVEDFAEYMGVNVTAAVFPPAGIVWSIYLEKKDEAENPPYVYRPLPEVFLAPAAFASEPERDAWFSALEARLTSAADAARSRVDAECRYWPCKETDAACNDPVCEFRRSLVAADLAEEMNAAVALRAQARIVPP